jgi:hypothetical protein
MFPYNGRPTEEFLREYRNKLNELQELMESQGLKLEIKSGGRCKVAPEVRAGIGKVSDEGDANVDYSFLLSYHQQYNAKADTTDDDLESETVYETYDDYLEFERKLTLIHETKENGVVIDFGSDFLDLTPVEEERLLYKEEAQLYGRFCQEVMRCIHVSSLIFPCLESQFSVLIKSIILFFVAIFIEYHEVVAFYFVLHYITETLLCRVSCVAHILNIPFDALLCFEAIGHVVRSSFGFLPAGIYGEQQGCCDHDV